MLFIFTIQSIIKQIHQPMLQMCCLFSPYRSINQCCRCVVYFHHTKYDKTDQSTNAVDVLFIFTIQSIIKQINQPMLQMCCLFSPYRSINQCCRCVVFFHHTKYDKTDQSTNAADVLFIFTIQSMIKQINQPML